MIRAQSIDNTGFSITLADGRVFSKTKQEIQTIVGQQSGNAAARKAATIAIIKAELATFLGDSMDVNEITFDFAADGTPNLLERKKP